MAQHTPGPWVISSLDGRTIGPLYDEPVFGGGEITRQKAVASVKERTGETVANACLIAAAPELLAALKALVNMQKGHENWPEVKAAEAAIAKAESP